MSRHKKNYGWSRQNPGYKPKELVEKDVHPNSMAAKKWKKRTFRSYQD